jgi:tetratricopeptide (TPR) repeat protein
VYLDYARSLVLLGAWDVAEVQYRKALAAQPGLTAASRELGSLSLEVGRLDAAERWLRESVRHDPADGVARRMLAQTLYRLDRAAAAIATLDEALALGPDQPDLHVMLATLHELNNDLPAAQRHARTGNRLDPGNPSAAVILAKLAMRGDAPTEALAWLDAVDVARLTDAQQVTRHAERGRALDRLGRYEDALAAHRQSRECLFRLQKDLPAQAYEMRAARMTAVETGLSRSRWQRLALCQASPGDIPADSPQPILVLGFSRSGTTLIEHILGAHPDIAPLGELSLIADAADALAVGLDGGYPEGLFALDPAHAREILEVHRQRYLAAVRERLDDLPAVRFFVDKAPFNTEHIGLVRLLFPEAPIIHAMRHPLDIVLSNFLMNFADPQPWSFSLDTAASLFVRMHDHLRAMTPDIVGEVLPVRYEGLVGNPEATMRAMLDHVGVAWDAACLKFHENAGGVRTASYAQVARPLYDSSVFRYRNYLPFIDTATLDRLRPAVEALGYDYSA